MTSGSIARKAKKDDAHVAQSITLLVMVCLLMLSVVAIWTANRSNDLAAVREMRLAINALEMRRDLAASTAKVSATSDEAYLRLHRNFDTAFADTVLSRDVAAESPHDVALLVRPGTQDVLAHDRLGVLDGTNLAAILSDVRTLAERIQVEATEPTPNPRTNASTRPSKQASHTEMMAVAGRPAIVTAVSIAPQNSTVIRRPGPAAVLVTIAYFGAPMAEEIAHTFVLPELAWTSTTRAEGRDGSTFSMPVSAADGTPLGSFSWRSAMPGDHMQHNLVPLTLIASFCVVVLAAFVVRRLRGRAVELGRAREQAEHAAMHDGLSGLANRINFNHRLDEALTDVRARPNAMIGVVYVDLDRFKDINDTLGHQAGDEVIRQTARRLQGLIEPVDTAARIAGDEFAMIIRSAGDRNAIAALLERAVEAIAQPISFGERTIYPGGSVGCALAPDDGLDRAELLHRADLALYRAKGDGRGRWLIFSIDMDDGHRKRQALRQDLRSAIAEDRLTVLYQPFFAVEGMKAVGVEARVAWNHPHRGRIPAAEFIPVAEESGMIRDLGLWVLRRSCQDASNWPGMALAINVSPLEMRHPNFAEDLLQVLREEKFDPGRLQVDLTENILLSDADVAIVVIERLRAAGVRIALDEFGSGQSSFNSLQRFRFDMVKIDRNVMARVEMSNEIATIVQTTVELAHRLGLKTAAEGIETFGQYRFIQALGCDTVQGHLCARPMPPEDIKPFMESPLGERLKSVA